MNKITSESSGANASFVNDHYINCCSCSCLYSVPINLRRRFNTENKTAHTNGLQYIQQYHIKFPEIIWSPLHFVGYDLPFASFRSSTARKFYCLVTGLVNIPNVTENYSPK